MTNILVRINSLAEYSDKIVKYSKSFIAIFHSGKVSWVTKCVAGNRIFYFPPFLFFIFTFSLLLSGCNDDDNSETYKMDDGLIVCVNSEVNYYETEDSFLCANTNWSPYSFLSITAESEVTRDSVYGYDNVDTLKWEKAAFGRWINKYGLMPNVEYFVQTVVVTKRIPSDNDHWLDQRRYKKYDMDSIGINPCTNEKGFEVLSSFWDGGYSAYTIIKQIGYDKRGRSVRKYYPVAPSELKWKYVSRIRIW